jgi:hypothetical protein
VVLSSAVDARMWLEEGTRVKTVGYVLIALAMTAFGFSALFLDFYGGQALPPGVSFTYFTSLRGGPEGGDAAVTLGAVMTAFGGPLAILILSLLGLRHPDSEPVRFSLIGAVAVWSITILGLAVVQWARDLPVTTGFWVQAIAIGVALVGLFLVYFSVEAGQRPEAIGTAPSQGE